MIDGTYRIKIDVLFGRKFGTVVLRTEGDVMFADIDAPVVGKQHLEGHVEGNAFSAKGSGRILLLGKVDFVLNGEVSGDDIRIDINTNKGDLKLEGVRV